MIIFMFFVDALARQHEEFYNYQKGLFFTQPQEDFIIIQNQIRLQIEDQKAIKIYDKIGLIGQKNHRMDRIIDMKQNQFGFRDYIWILYQIDNQSILSKQSIDDWELQENYYLHLDFKCYTFYFISISQIVIDCQNQRSNILVLYEIKLKLQQSYYHSYYKEAKFRKFLQISSSDKFVLIQQEQFIILCRQQNNYKVCNQFTYQHDAHTGYIQQDIIILVSDCCIYSYQLNGKDNQISQIQEENEISKYLEIKFPLKFYVQRNQFSSNYYVVYSDLIKSCYKKKCKSFVFNCCAIKVDYKEEYLIIQTQSKIEIFCMRDYTQLTIKRQFNNEIILVNSILQEFYISNNSMLNYYGLSSASYLRVTNQTTIINHYQSYFQLESFDDRISILFDPIFRFQQQKYDHFLLIGGLLDITFSIEDKYKDIIEINHDYFLKKQYQEVQYFFMQNDDQGDPYLSIISDQRLFQYDLQRGLIHEDQLQIQDFNFLQKIESQNQAYQMQDIRNDQQYIMFQDNGKLETFKINCDSNFNIVYYKKSYYVCQNDSDMRFYIFDIRIKISIFKNSIERFLDYDQDDRILYLINDTQLIILFYEGLFFEPFHSQQIQICSDFINIVVLQYKLVLVCKQQMILYNKISNFRYVYSGDIELYGQKFNKDSQIIQNDFNLFYIIDDNTLHVFNSNLPLSQFYVTKIFIDKFDDVKSQNQHICFQYNQSLQCYYFQHNIKFIYDLDQVEYHQAFKVDVCGENIYDKKCKYYTTRLDQKNRKISINKPFQSIVINKNTKEIILDNKYFSGTVEKIFVNNYLQRPKLQLEAYLSINYILGKKTLYYGEGNLIYIINNQTLLVYNIQSKQIQKLLIQKPVTNIFKYQNYLLLIGQKSTQVLSCNIDCKERIILNLIISYHSTLFITNKTLYINSLKSLRIYDVENMINNQTPQPIEEELQINQLDISSDREQQSCIVWLDYSNLIFFRYKGEQIQYDISITLLSLGISLDKYSYYTIYSIKLVYYCKILFINTNFGSYFLELKEELKFLAQIVTSSQSIQNRVLQGQKFLFYIQYEFQYVIIFRFTEDQIYNSKYIDFFQTLQLERAYDLKEYYFYIFKDDLYLVYPDYDYSELLIQKINLDATIPIENIVNKNQNILITLTNSDETKSFIIELQIEQSYWCLMYWIIILSLLVVYIYLIYSRTKQHN